MSAAAEQALDRQELICLREELEGLKRQIAWVQQQIEMLNNNGILAAEQKLVEAKKQ